MTYKITEEKRKQFASWFLLDKIINQKVIYPLMLRGDDSHLEDLLTYMLAHEWIDIQNDRCYVATEKGRECLRNFKRRYQDFLKNFDVYCAVDLESGEFAFEEFFEYEDEDLWNEFLEEERWEDLRIAVAVFKGIDPLEVVFMALLNEGRIDDERSGWQFDLLLGSIWDDLLEICNSALKVEQLAYEDEDGEEFDGDSVLKDIIFQGSKLNQELWEEEAATVVPPPIPGSTTVEAEPITTEVYVYYVEDPYYISPVWRWY